MLRNSWGLGITQRNPMDGLFSLLLTSSLIGIAVLNCASALGQTGTNLDWRKVSSSERSLYFYGPGLTGVDPTINIMVNSRSAGRLEWICWGNLKVQEANACVTRQRIGNQFQYMRVTDILPWLKERGKFNYRKNGIIKELSSPIGDVEVLRVEMQNNSSGVCTAVSETCGSYPIKNCFVFHQMGSGNSSFVSGIYCASIGARISDGLLKKIVSGIGVKNIGVASSPPVFDEPKPAVVVSKADSAGISGPTPSNADNGSNANTPSNDVNRVDGKTTNNQTRQSEISLDVPQVESVRAEIDAPSTNEPSPKSVPAIPSTEMVDGGTQVIEPVVTPADEPMVALKNANVRNYPGTHGTKVALIRRGKSVTVVGHVVGLDWALVTQDGTRLGYVYAPLLGELPVVIASPTSTSPTKKPQTPVKSTVATTKPEARPPRADASSIPKSAVIPDPVPAGNKRPAPKETATSLTEAPESDGPTPGRGVAPVVTVVPTSSHASKEREFGETNTMLVGSPTATASTFAPEPALIAVSSPLEQKPNTSVSSAAPGDTLPPATAVSPTETKTAEVETALTPLLTGNPDAVAVIIGNRAYRGRIPAVDFAHNDASAMKRFVIERLGYREGNIIDLRDATQADLSSVFGSALSPRGKLWRWVRPGQSDVTIFYSGHGVPGLEDRRSYLLPVDADPNQPAINGYPLDRLYKNLSLLPARTITVYLDACFSGDSPKGMLIRATSGLTVQPKPLPTRFTAPITVLTAAGAGELASWDEGAKHGLFTRYLLDALAGAADGERYGDGNGEVTVAEVKRYLDREMTYAARRTYGRNQSATVIGDEARVVAPAME